MTPQSRLVAVVVPLLLLSACMVTPYDGPRLNDVHANAEVTVGDASSLGYALVRLTPSVVTAAQAVRRLPTFRHSVAKRAAPEIRIGLGDSVMVTIFEASAGGLFIPIQSGARPGNFVQLPNQQIDNSGIISVPYAGQIAALGRTIPEIQKEIEAKLANRAIEPQVVVSLADRKANSVSVLGEVNLPTRFPLDPGGIELLGAIARGGGPKYAAHESVVTLQRGRQVDQVPMTLIVKNPSENVALLPGDVVFVTRQPRYFLALGGLGPFTTVANNQNRRVPFDDDNLSLADGIAKAGGLDSSRSNPKGVFLYRQEQRDVLKRLGVDVSKFSGPVVPTIYAANVADPDGYFLAGQFFMRDKDIIYVSDAASIDFLKFMLVVNSITSATSNAATTVSEGTAAARNLDLIRQGR